MRHILFLLIFLCSALLAQGQTSPPQSVTSEPPPPVNTRPASGVNAASFYEFADQMPVFPGGFEEFAKYVAEHVHYPDSALKQGIQGTVYLKAIIDTDGSIYDIQVLKGINGLNEAAIAVLKDSPRWTPGKQNGQPVKVRATIPIRFVLPTDAPKADKKQ